MFLKSFMLNSLFVLVASQQQLRKFIRFNGKSFFVN